MIPTRPDKQPPSRAADRAACRHCGTAFRPTAGETEFCCGGCRFVYGLLHKRGLEDFYRFGDVRTPVASGVFHPRSWEWLERLQQEQENTSDATPSLTLRVQGISCAGCIWLLEAVFDEQPGARGAEVDSSGGTIRLRWDRGACDLATYAADMLRFGYVLGPPGPASSTNSLRPLVKRMGLCAALALNAMLFALPRYLGLAPDDRLTALCDFLGFLLATASLAVGGPVFFRRAGAALRRGELHIDFPISLGLIFAYAGSVLAWKAGNHAFAYFDFVSVFTFLMLVGRWLQERAVEGNRRRLLDTRLGPGSVRVTRGGVEQEAGGDTLREGEIFVVGVNALLPVRSSLKMTPAVFALSGITGEPAPREFPAGAPVPAGARNLGPDPVTCEAMEDWENSRLSRLLRFDAARVWSNRRLQRVIRFALFGVLAAAGGGFLAWGLSGAGWIAAWQVMISVLVVSCPCAIGVALPLLDDVAAARLQACGVFLREHTLWQRLRRVRHILLDKTGTLTLEHLALANPEAMEALGDEARRCLLTLVSRSLHPVAACLRECLLAEGITAGTDGLPAVREILGHGLEWDSPQGLWRLGKPSWAAPGNSGQPAGTVFSLEGVVLAEFFFREELRPDAAGQVAALRRAGFGIWILSGDDPARVRAMARKLGLPEKCGVGGLTPEGKAELVNTRWGTDSLMLGDGANDSLAFDAALCRGTPASDTGLLELKADFYFLGRGLGGLGQLFTMSRLHHRAGVTVVAFAACYNLVAVGFALAGLMNPLLAAIVMPLSSLASVTLLFSVFRARPRKPTHHTP